MCRLGSRDETNTATCLSYHRLLADGVETVDVNAESNFGRFFWTIKQTIR